MPTEPANATSKIAPTNGAGLELRQEPASKRKPAQRFSRLTTLSLVLLGMLVVGAVAHYGLGLDFLTGQIGAVVALGAVGLFLLGQFIRFRQRISLRTLLMIVTVLAIVLAFIGRNVADRRSETIAVEQLVERGAEATYGDWRKMEIDDFFVTESGWHLPIWVRDWMGEGYFLKLRRLRLNQGDIKDQDLALLAEIKSLESLSVSNHQITATGIANIPLTPGLKSLSLSWQQVSPESVARLGEMRDLKILQVWPGTAGAAALPAPKQQAACAAISQLQDIENLGLISSLFDSKSMAEIAKMKSLHSLNLASFGAWPVTDVSGFAELANSPSINAMSIRMREFTDAELEQLSGSASLTRLYLQATSVTADGVRAFRAARPNVEVTVSPPIPGLDIY